MLWTRRNVKTDLPGILYQLFLLRENIMLQIKLVGRLFPKKTYHLPAKYWTIQRILLVFWWDITLALRWLNYL